jgi:hypothetical protein
MNLPGVNITNFDEFNSFKFNNQAPEDFEFNAILWFYEIDDGSGVIYSNLYGIEFLNNPNDDFDDTDPDGQKIRPFQKLVSNGNQDGLSYIYNLNITNKTDNDVVPMQYDPSTTYNNFSFDLYQNILQTNYNLQENFTEIISGFTYIQDEIFKVKSLVYSQQQYEVIQQRLDNLDSLLNLYSTMRMVDSPTAKIETDYNGVYPSAKINVVQSEYSEIQNLTTESIRNQNEFLQGSLPISVPRTNKKLLNIENNSNVLYDSNLSILLNRDLNLMQSMDIYIKPNVSDSINKLNININYQTSNGFSEQNMSILDLPTDLIQYNETNPEDSTESQNRYIDSKITEYCNNIDTNLISGKTLLILNEQNTFNIGETIFISNFYLEDENNSNSYRDFSGAYKIENIGNSNNNKYYQINLSPNIFNKLKTKLVISNFNGYKINILRVTDEIDDTLENRYKITKELL